MGIYRTWLEEEVPHLDETNDPDGQIKELEDIIANSDANEAEQDDAQEAAFGPDGGVDDILDESWVAIAEFEAGNNDIMKAIGYHELNEAAEGREFVLESMDDIKGFFKSAKDKIIAFFKKVWSVIQRWAGNIAALATTNKKFVEKYGAKIDQGYSLVKGDKAKSLKGFSFSGLAAAIGKTDGKDTAAYIKKVKTDGKSTDAEFYEGIASNYRKALCGSACSQSEFASKLKENIFGESEPKQMLMDPKNVKEILSGRKDDVSAVKKFMKEAKAQFKTALDTLNEFEREAAKKDSGSEREKAMAIATRAVTCMRSLMSSTQVWRSQTIHGINARARQARRYGMAYVAAANKNTHKGFQKESTEYGFLGNYGLV